MAKELKITQVKSAIGYRSRDKATLKALGIRKMNHTVTQKDSPAMRGMVRAIAHLVKVEEV